MMILLLLSTLFTVGLAVPPIWYTGGPCGISKYGAAAGSQPLPPFRRQIVGGVEAQPWEWPWQASLRRKSTNSHFCGGFIINELWVMTASHCMSGETPAILSVVIGDHTRNDASNSVRQTLDVAAIFMHEDYNTRTLENDIALIKLTAPIAFNENIQPVCAPDANDNHNYKFTVCSGWGTLSSGGACCPQTLQYVTMNITTNAFCDAEYPTDAITPDMICASDNTGGNQRDSCQGDSGGPLIVRTVGAESWTIAGIVSWGIGCASGYPGVYARVSFHNDWILDKLANN